MRRAAIIAAIVVAVSSAMPLTRVVGRGRTFVTHDCMQVAMQPRSIIFTCADGGFYMTRGEWTSWHRYRAVGSALFHRNDCRPSCDCSVRRDGATSPSRPPNSTAPTSIASVKLNHLAIAVRDQQRSIAFYATYFGFDPSTARRYPDGVVIIRNPDGFALALGEDRSVERAAGFPHFGFDPGSTEEIRRLRDRLVADGFELVEEEDTQSYIGFKCLDPDRHVIEVSLET